MGLLTKGKKESSLNLSNRWDFYINFKHKISSDTIFLKEKIENRITKPTTLSKPIKKLNRNSFSNYKWKNEESSVFKIIK